MTVSTGHGKPVNIVEVKGEVTIAPDARERMLELIRQDPDLGDLRAARLAGVPGMRSQIGAAIAKDHDLQDEIRQARRDGLGRIGLGTKRMYQVIAEIVEDRDHKDRLKAAIVGLNFNGIVAADKQQIELTGVGGGALEVTVEHDYGRLLDKLANAGLIRRPDDTPDPPGQRLLPARTD